MKRRRRIKTLLEIDEKGFWKFSERFSEILLRNLFATPDDLKNHNFLLNLSSHIYVTQVDSKCADGEEMKQKASEKNCW